MSERKWVFEKATKKRAKLRMAIAGPAKSGKTYTALTAATALANGAQFAVIDTEKGSASKFSDLFDFDVLELEEFAPSNYVEIISVAENAGYSVLVIDSLSHAWTGKGGVLELHDLATQRHSGNSWSAWRDVTPKHRELVEAILRSGMHIIATMRSKMDYIQSQDGRGKNVIRKVGLAPVQRQDMEYEFDILANMTMEHTMNIEGSRCPAVEGKTVNKPDAPWFQVVVDWLSDGTSEPERMRTRQETPATQDNEASSPDKEESGQANRRHWIDREGVAAAFKRWRLEELKITEGDALTALGVEDIHGYAGSMKEARERIETWLDRQRTPKEAFSGNAEPRSPEEVMAELRAEADKGSTRNAPLKWSGAAAGCLDRLFPDDAAEVREAKRHALTLQIFGVTSSKHLSGGQASALIEWASIGGDGDDKWEPNSHAIPESAAIVKLYEAEKGQADMVDAEEAEQEEIPY